MAKERHELGGRTTASQYGWDISDSTTAISSAIASGASATSIPYMSGQPWLTDPVTLTAGHRIYLEDGGYVKATSDGYGATANNLIKGNLLDDVAIVGENDCVLEMRSESLSVDATGPHIINLRGCTNGLIEGVRCVNASGDGVYLGPDTTSGRVECQDVVVRRVTVDAARRNGMSVTAGQRITIEDCILKNTSGASPQAGLDVEPPNADDPISAIVIRNCLALDNNQTGFMASVANQTTSSDDMDVLFDSCKVRGGTFGLRAHREAPSDVGPGGTIEFRDCTITGTTWQGIWLDWDTGSASTIKFTRCRIVNAATLASKFPILIEAQGTVGPDASGGVVFENCLIVDNQNRDPLSVTLDGITDPNTKISGTIFVVNPFLTVGTFDAGITQLDVQIVASIPALFR